MQLAQLIPHSEQLLLEGVGHVTVMQATELVADALTDFLTTKETSDASRR
jgi:pimeloyl-ACP methyl ester carboxylesterase